jgi:hypothetical protein
MNWLREDIKWKKEKKFQAKKYMRCVIIHVQLATKRDILITGRYALFVLAQVARIKSTVNQQVVSVANLSSKFLSKYHNQVKINYTFTA